MVLLNPEKISKTLFDSQLTSNVGFRKFLFHKGRNLASLSNHNNFFEYAAEKD